MNKVTSINLNGNAYQLDEQGYAALSAYLEEASAHLAENPDKAEIVADLEQAIADKLRRFQTAHRSVVSVADVQTVITEMGPVDGGTSSDTERAASSRPGPKRLYRIADGKILGGVATGLAAYLNVDVVLIRVVMFALLFITGGGFIFGYILAWIFIPAAVTGEQQAQAHGQAFNAEEIISRASAAVEKGRAEGMKHWNTWKTERKAYKKAARQAYRDARMQEWHHARPHGGVVGELFGLLAITFALWLAYHHIPDVHYFLDSVWAFVHRASDWFAEQVVLLDR